MSKYFRNKQKTKINLSTFLNINSSKLNYCSFNEEYITRRTKYIMEILGDVYLDEDTYILFLSQFQRYGGKYNVRTNPETFEGMYEIYKRFPYLSVDALSDIWDRYIEDLFEEYLLLDFLEEYIKTNGQFDDVIKEFLKYVDKCIKLNDKKYDEESKNLKNHMNGYDKHFIEYLINLIKKEHIKTNKIIKSIPSKDLVCKDKEQYNEIITKTGNFTNPTFPLSYRLTELNIKEDLDKIPNELYYTINNQNKIEATFTKEEFLNNIIDLKQKRR